MANPDTTMYPWPDTLPDGSLPCARCLTLGRCREDGCQSKTPATSFAGMRDPQDTASDGAPQLIVSLLVPRTEAMVHASAHSHETYSWSTESCLTPQSKPQNGSVVAQGHT